MNPAPNATAQTADFEFAALSEAKNYREALLRDFSKYLRGHVLEVGAGIGQITGMMLHNPAIQKLVSIEPDPKFCDRLRITYPSHRVIQGTIGDLIDNEPWNAILNVNVLEHIQADEQELAVYRQILAPTGGALCLFVPARPEIYAPIDKDFGHFRRYTKPELRQKLERAGFKIVCLRYYNFIGYFAWWLTFCALRKRRFDLSSVRLFDRVLFPPVHAMENLICAPPIGQSLLAIAVAR
jgi:SAM-dependent methyltransferase